MKRIFSVSIFLVFIFSISIAQTFEGYVLYNSMGGNTTYLIDKNKDIVREWSCESPCAYSAYLRPNGNMIRAGMLDKTEIKEVSAGSGLVEEYSWNGDLIWKFKYSSEKFISHHDIAPMPNGNVLLVALEIKTKNEAMNAGRNNISDIIWSPQIVEVAPDGSGGGKIVWQWNLWDHLIQDKDPLKENYGVVKDHPELFDINLGNVFMGDWVHVNGVDYNEELDQITFSSRLMSEVYIIDHSTTTEQAASHTGGNSGKGGDILYRWGNPNNYGAEGDKGILDAVHDAHWNGTNTPMPGFLSFFNNGKGNQVMSKIDMLETPIDGSVYKLTKGESYAPKNKATWSHTAHKSAWGQSSSQLMPNGNLFVCINSGYFYEVDKDNNKIWEFEVGESVAKAFRYEQDYVTSIKKIKGEEVSFNVFPNPSNGRFFIEGDFSDKTYLEAVIFDISGKQIKRVENQLEFDLSSLDNGIYFLKIRVEDKVAIKKIALKIIRMFL